MSRSHRSVSRLGLVFELGLWMLVIALVPVALTVFLSNATFESALSREVRARLERIASESTRRIEAYANGLVIDVGLVAENSMTVQALSRLSSAIRSGGIDGPTYRQMSYAFDGYFTALRGRKNWADVLLIDQHGQIVYAARRGEELGVFLSAPQLANTELARSVATANTLLQSEVSNFSYYGPARTSATFLAAPIFENRTIIGNIVMRIDPQDLQSILSDVSGLGMTGEVIAGAIYDNALHLVAPLSHQRISETTSSRLDSLYWPLVEALSGREGAGAYVDYLDTPTEAVWRFIPSLNWAMVAKIDSAEVYAASKSFRKMSLFVVLVSLLFVGIGAYLSYRAISRPIVRLAGVVGSLTGEHLPPQLPVMARNEIGILISSFNRLISRLREHQSGLEKTVQDRTAALQDSEAKLRQYIRVVDENVPTATLDSKWTIRSVSNAYCRMSDRARGTLIGLSLRELLHPDISDRELDQIWSTVGLGYTWKGELKYLRKDGQVFHTDEVITPEFENGVLTRVTTVLRDISDRKRVEKLSITDELTGLYNRRHLNAVFEREAVRARREGHSLGLLLWDVDFFKRYNDHYGHQAGDVVLQRLATAARDCFKGTGDLAFRLGGEEFGILLEVNDHHELRLAGERLVDALAALQIGHLGNEIAPFVTISAGAATLSASGDPDLDEIYLRADQSLYLAKQAGRNRMVCWQPPGKISDRPSSEVSSLPS